MKFWKKWTAKFLWDERQFTSSTCLFLSTLALLVVTQLALAPDATAQGADPPKAAAEGGDPSKATPAGVTSPTTSSLNTLSADSKPVHPARQAVFELDKRILLICADFARFRLRFHAEANRSGFWRSWIYPLEQETGTALSFSNTLTDLTQRARGLQDPDKISRPSVKRGLACAITGQTITASSSSIELLHNGYRAWSAGCPPR